MSQVLVCKRCKKIFNSYFDKDICQSCESELEEGLKRVKDYLWDHKGASIDEVTHECEVDRRDIKTWLKQERIQLGEDSTIELECEKCGCRILSGKYCDRCKFETVNALNGIVDEARQAKIAALQFRNVRDSGHMRFVGNNKL